MILIFVFMIVIEANVRLHCYVCKAYKLFSKRSQHYEDQPIKEVFLPGMEEDFQASLQFD